MRLPLRFQKRLPRRFTNFFLALILVMVFYTSYQNSEYYRAALRSPFRLGRRPSPDQLDDPIRFVPGTFDWASLPPKFPIDFHVPLPAGEPLDLPDVQFDFSSREEGKEEVRRLRVNAERREAVKSVFQRGWKSYMDRAWGYDELAPVSGRSKTTFGGWSATLVDGLDTLWIMGLRDEFHHAAQLACSLDFAHTSAKAINVFETNIRHLGGLLAAYDLSGEPALLAKATELGNLLYVAFDTPNRMPVFWLNFADARKGKQEAGFHEPSAAAGSLCVEMTRLAQLTGDAKFYDATERVRAKLAEWQGVTNLPGMWPVYLNWRNEVANEKKFSLGAEADSLYEYLPKMFALLGGQDARYANMTIQALDAARDHLLFRPMLPDGQGDKVLFSGSGVVKMKSMQRESFRLDPEVQHLGCFAGGMYGLAGRLLLREEYVALGEGLALGCAWAYEASPTGIMPEIFSVHGCGELLRVWEDGETNDTKGETSGVAELMTRSTEVTRDEDLPDGATETRQQRKREEASQSMMHNCDWDLEKWESTGGKGLPVGYRRVRDPRYLLRPEAIESLFYMWRITGREEFREHAWNMFEAVRNATATRYGNGELASVLVEPGRTKKADTMESFWFSETLKYFYLIFSPPDVISLDDYVFNTEAHPLKRPKRVMPDADDS